MAGMESMGPSRDRQQEKPTNEEPIDVSFSRRGQYETPTKEEYDVKRALGRAAYELRQRVNSIYTETVSEGGSNVQHIKSRDQLSPDQQAESDKMSESLKKLKQWELEEDELRSSGAPKEEVREKSATLWNQMREELAQYGLGLEPEK